MIFKVILGLGSVAGGTLAAWRLVQEVVEIRKLGPPAWWVIQRHPVTKSVDPPHMGIASTSGLLATRVFRWEKDRWIPLTPYVFEDSERYVTQSQPEGRSLYVQVYWRRKHVDGVWTATTHYAANVKDQLPR